MKTVYPDENNVVLDENSVERKLCINRESKNLELTIYLYSFHDINTNFLVVVTSPSIYQYALGGTCVYAHVRSCECCTIMATYFDMSSESFINLKPIQ